MKKLLILIIISLLSISGNAQAATKIVPGTKCAKSGITQNYNGKKYTCIKLGSSLYWNNGTNIPSNSNSLLKTPATCTVLFPQWRAISENGVSNSDGKIILSAMLLNSSISNIATSVKVNIEWFDAIGLNYKKIIEVPRLYPGQTLKFGDIDLYSLGGGDFPDLPNHITVKSACKSTLATSKDLIDGKFPILTGESVVNSEKIKEFQDEILVFSTDFIIKNIFKKLMRISQEVDVFGSNKVHVYGVMKDKYGNILGGYNEYLRGDLTNLQPGDTFKVNIQLLELLNAQNQILNKIDSFEYTIIPD